MIIVTGSFTASDDTLEELLRLSLEHVVRSRLEPGCLMHTVHQDVEDHHRVVFLEHWSDLDALRTHFAVPESRAFARSIRDLAREQSPLGIYESVGVEI